MSKIIAWGNPILLAVLAGAAGVRLFDFVDRGNWQPIDLLSMAFLALFGLGWSITMQRHLASKSQ